MKRRRVKITGIGPITPAGVGRHDFTRGLLEPTSRVRAFKKLDPSLGSFAAAYVDKFAITDFLERSEVPRGSARHTLFAIAATKLAMEDAAVNLSTFNSQNAAVVVGSSLMDFEGIGRTIENVVLTGLRGALARTVYTTNASVIPASIVRTLGLNARTLTIQTSCCAGMDAIGYAARMIALGEVDIALCGGTEAPLFRCPLVELRAAGLTPCTTEAARRLDRPFDLWRTTGVVSEGACMLVLEPSTSPRTGYCLIDGYASANDNKDKLCSGLEEAIIQATANAELKINDIEVINTWGPGHPTIDAAEVSILNRVFGARLHSIPAVSIKGAIGNPLGAAPAIQVASAALAVFGETIPPTVNWEYPDPQCGLNLSAHPRFLPHQSVLVNAHGLSGINSSIIMQKC